MDTDPNSCKNYLKIFRPWDVSGTQDSTVSTTSNDASMDRESVSSDIKTDGCSKNQKISACEVSTKHHPKAKSKTKRPQKSEEPAQETLNAISSPFLPCEPYLYPETMHANLAQSLGLNPSDSLFLESVAQGYAFEEYARIISQEQHAKMLNGKKQRPKKYKCPHCDVGFSNNGQLKGHIRIHTGERPYHCDEKNCGKTFTRNEELTRHKRIHSGLRPFPCNQCGKRFGRKDHLKKHTRTHMQQRGMYAVPVMLPMEAWSSAAAGYPYLPLYGY